MLRLAQYSEVLEALEDGRDFLRTLGLHKSTDRLQQLTAHVAEINEAFHTDRLDELSTRPDHEDLVWALVDAIEFIDILKGLRNYDPEVLAPLLRKALRGTLHPGKETAHRSNIGRNTAFELRVASGIAQAGGKVTLGEAADLKIELETATVYVECKRPFGPDSVRANIEEAREQLTSRMNSDASSAVAGVVAISASRVLNPTGSRLFVADTPESIRDLAADLVRIHESTSSDFDSLPDLRQLGLLYHAHIPAYVRSIPTLTGVTQSAVFFSGAAVQTVFPVSNGESLKKMLVEGL